MLPVHLLVGRVVTGAGREELVKPSGLPGGVLADELEVVTADQVHQVGQQGQGQSCGREVAAVVADDPQQGAQVAFADRHRGCHGVPPSPGALTLLPWCSVGHTQNVE
jgi:hypothetical protein